MPNEAFHVAIIGAGMSGMYLSEQLSQAGIAHTIFEKAPEVGGTWYANTYPGLHVDVLTRSYEFPFARHRAWSKRYAPGHEIQDYLVQVSHMRRIREHVIFNCGIAAARFDGSRWHLTAEDGRNFDADVVVAATGFLRVPSIPAIPGRDTFAGPAFHSARWNHSVDMAGKHVGVIGTGSSGVQIVTELGRRGNRVTQFVRTPQWMMIRSNPKVSWLERMLLRVPGTGKLIEQHLRRLRKKIEGPDTWRFQAGEARDRVRAQHAEELARALPDPELRRKLTPSEPAGCKRIPKTEHYYDVVQQPNVEIVAGGVKSIEPTGVVDIDGKLHEIDVLVFATGFDAHAYIRPMQVENQHGKTVDQLWENGVFSYYGIGIPEMPNFFLMSGPFAPVNLIPVPASARDQCAMLMPLIDKARTEHVAIAPTMAATMRLREEIRAEIPRTTFGECDNWFTDKSGTPVLWPWNQTEHSVRLSNFVVADFEIAPATVAAVEHRDAAIVA